MIARIVLITFLSAVPLASLAWAPAEDPNEAAMPRAGNEPASRNADSDYEFVGSKRCRSCHGQVYRSWAESSKGRSWDALRPHRRAESKITAGLDPETDYATDAQCLSCHAVGFGRRGGYLMADPGDRKSVRHAEERQGVGCEACHGPGSGFVQAMLEIYEDERPYRREELIAAGRRVVKPEACLECHNESAICVAWKYEGANRDALRERFSTDIEAGRGFHERIELRYRLLGPTERNSSGSPLKGTE